MRAWSAPRRDVAPRAAVHLTLHLTDRCNLACRYCYARHGTADMSFATACAAIEKCATGPDCGIVFFGGEPLLEWQTLQEADAYADERCRASGLALQRTITTNMTLLTEDKIDWLVARHYRMGLSLVWRRFDRCQSAARAGARRPGHQLRQRLLFGTGSDCTFMV